MPIVHNFHKAAQRISDDITLPKKDHTTSKVKQTSSPQTVKNAHQIVFRILYVFAPPFRRFNFAFYTLSIFALRILWQYLATRQPCTRYQNYRHGDRKYSSHYGITLNRYFKHILPAGVVAQWLAAWTAGCTIGVRIPWRLKYFVLFFFNFFELILRSGEIGRYWVV